MRGQILHQSESTIKTTQKNTKFAKVEIALLLLFEGLSCVDVVAHQRRGEQPVGSCFYVQW
jgi:hypothetical protein